MRLLLIIFMAVTMAVSGCGAPKAESGKAAIQEAGTMQTAQEKTAYLMGQAKAFYDSKEFQDSIDVLQYVLQYLDKDSQAAKDLLEKVKEGMAAQMKQQADEVKKSFGGLGS